MRLGQFAPTLANALAASGLPVKWVIADDGSSAEEARRLGDMITPLKSAYACIELMHCSQRFRKGGAIYEAWNEDDAAAWFAFVDADGAIDAATVVQLLKQALLSNDKLGIIGVRSNTEHAPAHRPLSRAISFKLFTFLVHWLTGLKYSDTQCGVKIVPAIAYRSIGNRLLERGFVFDVELLLAMETSGCDVKEVPIPWAEIPDGKVRPLRDAWAMLGGLLRIRKRSKAGHYATA